MTLLFFCQSFPITEQNHISFIPSPYPNFRTSCSLAFDMEGTGNLQRSVISFRRQGSSGLVWDDKFLTADPNQEQPKGDIPGGSSDATFQRSRSIGGDRPYRTAKMPSPSLDPPSPKVSGCGLCGVFGKPVDSKQRPNFKGKRRS